MTGFFGGELGIRTLETFRSTAFRVLYAKKTLAENARLKALQMEVRKTAKVQSYQGFEALKPA